MNGISGQQGKVNVCLCIGMNFGKAVKVVKLKT